MAAGFEVDGARKKFPALQKEAQIFFDNAGGSQTLGTVITSISEYLSRTNVQLGATYKVGRDSTRLYTEGCKAGAQYINAEPDEVVIGPSTTQLFRNLSFSIQWQPHDEIIVSKLDHEANIASWVDIASRLNLKLKWWAPSPSRNPKLNPEDLRELLTPETRLVACTHTSNLLGTINDIKAIAQVVHEQPRAMLCVDGVAYAPHRRNNMHDLGVDFYAFSWYKVYGPHIAMLYASTDAQKQLTSLGHYFNPSATLENKLGLAGANYELTQAIPKVVEYFGGSGPNHEFMQSIAQHEQKLAEILLQYLRQREDVEIYGEPTADAQVRVPTISFMVRNWSPREVVETVEQKSEFGFRWGHFYSKRLCDDVLQTGEEGVIRVSMVHYNTEDEIKQFVKVFDELVKPRMS